MAQTFAEDVSLDGVKKRGNFLAAFFAGLLTALAATALWMACTGMTGKNYFWLALAFGGVTGLVIRIAGHGSSPIYALLGVALTLGGIFLTTLFTVIQSATTEKIDFYAVLIKLDLASIGPTILQQTSPLTYAVYALAVAEAAVLSVRWRVKR